MKGPARRAKGLLGRTVIPRRVTLAVRLLLCASIVAASVPAAVNVTFANGVPFSAGDVIASTGSGTFNHFTGSGSLIDTLNDGSGSSLTTEGCFDASGAFHGTNYS